MTLTTSEARMPYQKMLPLVFATSFFVFVEPAPFDLLACLLMVFAFFPYLKSSNIPLKSFTVWSVIFTLLQILTLPPSIDVGQGIKYLAITVYLNVFGLLLAAYIGRFGTKVIDCIMWGMYAGAAITAVVLLTTKVGVTGGLADIVLANDYTRMRGFFKDPNVFGPALIPVFIYGWMSFQQKSSYRMIHMTMALVAAILIILTLSRGAWVTFLGAAVLYYGLTLWSSNIRKFFSSMIMVTIGTVLMIPLMWAALDAADVKEIFEDRLTLQSYDEERFYIHHMLAEASLDNAYGHGPGQSNVHIRTYYTNVKEADAAHNTYLRVAFEQGWLGILAYMIFVIATAWVGLKACLNKNAVTPYAIMSLSIFAASVVSGLTVDTLHWRHFWIEVAFIWGIYALSFRQKSE